jgi:hypothetical protein
MTCVYVLVGCAMCSTMEHKNVMDEVFGENVPYQTFVWLA